jgi:hypothetical protein
MAQHLPAHFAFLYWLGLFLPKWAAMDLATRGVWFVVRKHNPSPWLCALPGGAIGSIAFKPLAVLHLERFIAAMQSHLPLGFAFEGLEPVFPSSLADIGLLIVQNGVSIGLWTFAVVAFVRVWEAPGYLRPKLRPAGANEPSLGSVETETGRIPHFLQRTRGLAQSQLLAIRAEDHYVRVIADSGEDLVLYRFSDALEELRDKPGYRVHRSYWVARDAIVTIEPENKNYVAVLKNGLRVPISRSNVGLLRAEGVIAS